MRRFCRLSALALAVVASGCGSSSSSSSGAGSAPPPPAPRQASSLTAAARAFAETIPPPRDIAPPSVRFVYPHDGATSGPTITARVALRHFTIDAASVGRAPRPGRGHLHFRLDSGRFDTPTYAGPNGIVGRQLGVTGVYSPALAPAITYSHLPAGPHTLMVFLANNNHTNTGVSATVHFRVR